MNIPKVYEQILYSHDGVTEMVLKEEYDKLKLQADKLAEALKFYGSLETYTTEVKDEHLDFDDLVFPIDNDSGDKARTILEAYREFKNTQTGGKE